MSRPPVIGITTDIVASITCNPYPYLSARRTYADAIERAGGTPIMLPSVINSVYAFADMIDGLVLIGGNDIAPSLYGDQVTHPTVQLVDPLRTQFEWKMLDLISQSKKPILGICGGMQLMNVWGGGSLYQDIALIKNKANLHLKNRGVFSSHLTDIEPNSLLSQTTEGKLNIYTNSFHHQAVQKVAPHFKVAAHSEDGVIEAIEHESDWILGVQWHPEYEGSSFDAKLISMFVERSRL